MLTGALFFQKGDASALHFLPPHRRPLALDGGAAAAPQDRKPAKPFRISMAIDPERHMRLKLTALRLGTTPRELMMAAFDHYQNTVVAARLAGGCLCIAAPAPSDVAAGSDPPRPEAHA
jgi:hypothetical protein